MDRIKLKQGLYLWCLLFLLVTYPNNAKSVNGASDHKSLDFVSDGFGLGRMGLLDAVTRQWMALEQLLHLKDNIEQKTSMSPAQKAEALEKLNAQIGDAFKKIGVESGTGRAIFTGFAGTDAKNMQNIPIKSVQEGLAMGLFVRMSSACSDVLKPRIESVADNVVGGGWDFFANIFGDIWNSLFHGGKRAFSVKNLRGWQVLVKTSFLDIDRLLRDGLKDSLRGQDMTLRDSEDATAEPIKINAWQFLVEGYARQFDYIVTQLDKHLEYYQDDEEVDVIVFYAQEIKRRLLETKSFLLICKSVRELDAFLESSKGLIPALNKNIDNLFERLIDLIASQVSQTKPTNTYTPSRTTYGGQRDTMTGGGIGDDADYPHSMRGW